MPVFADPPGGSSRGVLRGDPRGGGGILWGTVKIIIIAQDLFSRPSGTEFRGVFTRFGHQASCRKHRLRRSSCRRHELSGLIPEWARDTVHGLNQIGCLEQGRWDMPGGGVTGNLGKGTPGIVKQRIFADSYSCFEPVPNLPLNL
jgi:hypothetical protein